MVRALAIEPSERYATAREMELDLERAHPAASSRRVAAWIREIAGASLANRAAMVAKEESAGQDRGKRAVLVATLIVIVAMALAALWIGRRGS